MEWRRNSETLMPMLANNRDLAEIIEVAKSVADLCTIGLDALDGKPDASRVAELAKPKAEMLIQIAPGIQKLVHP